MTKKKPVGTVVEVANDYEDYYKNAKILMQMHQLFGPPGSQLGRRWWRRNVRVWKIVEHASPHGLQTWRNEIHWVMRLYFRNPADAVYAKLKIE